MERKVPSLGESVTEATVAKWFKKVGDVVAVDEPLVELETDKVTLEVPAPAAGVLSEIMVKDGDTVEVKDKSKTMALILEATQSPERDVPEYLQVDHDALKGSFIRAPKLLDVPYPVRMEPNLVIEFYSR